MLDEFGDDAKILGRRPEPGADARHAADVLREPDRHLPDRRTEEHRAATTTSSWIGGGHAARAGRHGRRGGRFGAAADVVDALHRPLPDPDEGHAGRRDRARRPGRGVRRGGARARRDDGGDVIAGPPADPGGRVLHRPVGDVVGVRRDPDRGAVPGVGRPVRLRGRGIRPAPRRFRDRGRRRSRWSWTATTGWRGAASDCSVSVRRRCAGRRPRTPSSAGPPTTSPPTRSAGSR